MSNKAISEMTADNRLLIELFVQAKPGEVVTHKQMNEYIGRQGEGNLMNTTIDGTLKRDHDIVVDSVRGIGYRVLLPEEVAAGYVPSRRKRIHRMARKAMKALATVARDALPTQQDKMQYDAQASMASVIEHATSNKSEKRIENAVKAKAMLANGNESLLATAETLEAMKGK